MINWTEARSEATRLRKIYERLIDAEDVLGKASEAENYVPKAQKAAADAVASANKVKEEAEQVEELAKEKIAHLKEDVEAYEKKAKKTIAGYESAMVEKLDEGKKKSALQEAEFGRRKHDLTIEVNALEKKVAILKEELKSLAEHYEKDKKAYASFLSRIGGK